MKNLFSNKRLTIAIIAIALVVIFTAYEWGTSMYWHKEIADLCEYENSCGEVEVSTIYDFSIKKIVLFSGIIFSSAFLLLSALRRND